eukprot:3601079-Pyramimonas_sp.AAC.1
MRFDTLPAFTPASGEVAAHVRCARRPGAQRQPTVGHPKRPQQPRPRRPASTRDPPGGARATSRSASAPS